MKFERIAHPLASQRVNGEAALAVRRERGRTRLAELSQSGASKIRMPHAEADPLEAILINTAGGMTGGDRLAWSIEVGPGASLVATTQTCEKAYRADGGEAAVKTRLRVAAGGRLAWLPQETIVFDRSALSRRIDVDLQPGSSALLCEATVFGRLAMGESVTQASFRDTWRVELGGCLVHAENLRMAGDLANRLPRPAIGNGAAAFATVLAIDPDIASALDAARAIVGPSGGVSAWALSGEAGGSAGKLLARLAAKDSYDLRRRLVPLLELLNGQAPLPKVWSL